MKTGWVRLSRKCNNACVFCLDADNLDGVEVPLETIQAAIDAEVAAGAEKLVLSGGEPTMSRHLLAAIRHAKSHGVYTSMTTNGRMIQSEKIAQMLERAGLDELRVSVHSGRRSTHDALAGGQGAWVQGLAGLRFACRTKMRVVMVSVLMKPNDTGLGHLMHLGKMAGISEMQMRYLRREGAALREPHAAELPLGRRGALKLLSTMWFDAKEEVILFTPEGFDNTLDVGEPPDEAVCHQADIAALNMLRRRVALFHASAGFTALDEFGMAKDFVGLVQHVGDLAELGLELVAHHAPLTDMPVCVGGVAGGPLERWGDATTYGPACDTCPARPSCAGVPRKLRKILGDSLRPLPWWSGLAPESSVLVVASGHDALLDGHTLPNLVEALGERGVKAELTSSVSDAQWSEASLVIVGSAAQLGSMPTREGDAGPSVMVLDSTLGLDLGVWPADALLRSSSPDHVGRVRTASVPLRQVSWRPYPVPVSVSSATAAPQKGGIVVFGETADWAVLQRALDLATGKLPPVWVVCSKEAGFPERPDVAVYNETDDEAMLKFILAARVVVFPHGGVDDTPEGQRALARDLRWLSVAAAAGRPVVAVRGPGVADHVRQDHTGFMVSPASPKALSEAMRRVANEVNRYLRYEKASRAVGKAASVAAWADEIVSGVSPAQTASSRTKWRQHPAW